MDEASLHDVGDGAPVLLRRVLQEPQEVRSAVRGDLATRTSVDRLRTAYDSLVRAGTQREMLHLHQRE